ncbi:glycosyltransferase family 4 protein [Paraburkholderia phytofirmans]|jgi:glycosyltransferase involved in cell wall biosynthesis|uniref:glycosyltransferase family 4 protein n=1 Tax=Paraburkholderia sp. BL9I2N2 TaxID=1938809 RepID=UPI0010466511|nr:glycosyltransferase family 4 protein [Paraburkholderia sp. BL9I2N2]TCK91227.1 glycosyltransferase involved in cell wall biosynthesis [Paraburkholderia sp. BL9I2N2]
MKILLFIHSLHYGGAERVAMNLSSEWVAQGLDVSVVTLTSTASDFYALHDSVDRITLDLAGGSGGLAGAVFANVRRMLALRRVLRQVKPDVVLGIETRPSILAILAGLGLPCKVIATEHIHPPMLFEGKLWESLRRWTYPFADKVVALTQKSKLWLQDNCNCKAVTVIPNSISLPIPVVEPIVPPQQVVGAGRRVLLAAGRMAEQKGFDILIDSFGRIASDFPAWDLVILGDGHDRDALVAQIAAAGLSERVLLPGQVGNMPDWYERADLYVLSSRFEGFSMTIVEAMASGCAVVSFDCDAGPGDIITHGHDGLLVRQVGDPQELANALSTLMSDDGTRALMAARARAVVERFSVARVFSMWRDVFTQTGVKPSGIIDRPSVRVTE